MTDKPTQRAQEAEKAYWDEWFHDTIDAVNSHSLALAFDAFAAQPSADGLADELQWWVAGLPVSTLLTLPDGLMLRIDLALRTRQPADGIGSGNHDCLAKRRPDEPMFIILGRDPDGGHIVRTWAERRRAAGGDASHVDPVFEIADRMDAYAADPANRPASAPPKEAYRQPADTVERVLAATAVQQWISDCAYSPSGFAHWERNSEGNAYCTCREASHDEISNALDDRNKLPPSVDRVARAIHNRRLAPGKAPEEWPNGVHFTERDYCRSLAQAAITAMTEER